MVVEQNNLWLCPDCMIVAVNGDESGVESEEVIAQIREGLADLGPHLVPSFDSDTEDGIVQRHGCCDACGRSFWSRWHRFAVLGEEPTLKDVEAFLAKKGGQLRVSHGKSMWHVRLYVGWRVASISSHKSLAQAIHDMIFVA